MTVTLPPDLADLLHRAGGKWPETDEDGARTVATAWRELSSKLITVREDAAGFAAKLTGENRGAAIDAFADYWHEFDRHLETAITASAKTAEVVDSVAAATERAKTGMVEVLESAQRKITAAENVQAVPVVGAVAGSAIGALLRWLLPLLGRVLWWLLRMLWRFLVWLAKLIWQGLVWLWKKIVELFRRLFKKPKPAQPPPGVNRDGMPVLPTVARGPCTSGPVPLETLTQCE